MLKKYVTCHLSFVILYSSSKNNNFFESSIAALSNFLITFVMNQHKPAFIYWQSKTS